MNARAQPQQDLRDRTHEPICVKETRVCWIEFGVSLACLLLGLILVFAGVSSDNSAVGPGGGGKTSQPTAAQAITYTGVALLLVGAILLIVFGVHFYRVKSRLDIAKAERFARLGIRPTSRYEALPSPQTLPPASLQQLATPPPRSQPPMPLPTRQHRLQQKQQQQQQQPPPQPISSRLQPMPSYREGAFCNLGFLGDDGDKPPPPPTKSGATPTPSFLKGGTADTARRGPVPYEAAPADFARHGPPTAPSAHDRSPPDPPRSSPGPYHVHPSGPARRGPGSYDAPPADFKDSGPIGFSRGNGGFDAPPAEASAADPNRGVKSSRSYHTGLSGSAFVLPASASGQDFLTRATAPTGQRGPPPSEKEQHESWQRTPEATPPWERSPPPQYGHDPYPLLHPTRAGGNRVPGNPGGQLEASRPRHSGYRSSQI